jgi:hypothetical protein
MNFFLSKKKTQRLSHRCQHKAPKASNKLQANTKTKKNLQQNATKKELQQHKKASQRRENLWSALHLIMCGEEHQQQQQQQQLLQGSSSFTETSKIFFFFPQDKKINSDFFL